MDVLGAALLLVAGLVAGFLEGVFGMGGGIVLVPVLLIYARAVGISSLVATHVAIGTSLLVTALLSGALSVDYRRSGHLLLRGVLFIAPAGIAGALLGSAVAAGLEGTSLRNIFGFLLIVAAVRLFSGRRKPGKDQEPKLSPVPLLGTGLLLGLLSSLSGVGGALVAVPLLYTYMHVPLRKATGTSAAAIALTAAAGAASYLVSGWRNEFLPPGMHGFIAWQAAIPLVLGAVPGRPHRNTPGDKGRHRDAQEGLRGHPPRRHAPDVLLLNGPRSGAISSPSSPARSPIIATTFSRSSFRFTKSTVSLSITRSGPLL